MRGHSSAARTVKFVGADVGLGSSACIHVASAGDDGSLRLWDLSTGDCVSTVVGAHDDYIRSSAVSLSGSSLLGGNIMATGSYDHMVRLWDLRMMGVGGGGDEGRQPLSLGEEERDKHEEIDKKDYQKDEDSELLDSEEEGMDEEEEEEKEKDVEVDASRVDMDDENGGGSHRVSSAPVRSSSRQLPKGCILSVDQGGPVTSVVLHGSSLVSTSGTTCTVWDILKSGEQRQTVSSHSKLVTHSSLDGTGTRYITCGLDGLVKVHSLGTFTVQHTARFSGQLLSLALPRDNSRILVGGVDGTLWVRQRAVSMGDTLAERKESGMLKEGGYRYFLRGRRGVDDIDDLSPTFKKSKLRPYDKALQAFNHGLALGEALATHSPGVISAMLRELLARNALAGALKRRNTGVELEPLLAFLAKYIAHPRYASLCADVMECVTEVFAHEMEIRGETEGRRDLRRDGISGVLETHFIRVRAALGAELGLSSQLLSLQGELDMLLANAGRS